MHAWARRTQPYSSERRASPRVRLRPPYGCRALIASAARVAHGRERGRRLARRRRRDALLKRDIDRAEPHALQLVGREPVERLPRRNAQRGFEQLPAAAHLNGVLREPSDIALHDIELLGRVARFQRLLALLAEPDLVPQHVRLGWHVAARAGEQQERAHGFAIAVG